MGAEEKSRNEILSRIVADLFDNSKGSEELQARIHRLRDELKKVIENEDTVFGKFRRLVESFREIIPEEKQRYNAALKALSTTSKLSQQEIVAAVSNQLEELKILEKVLLNAAPVWRDQHTAMEAKSREIRDEISKLREKIARLESEEKEILSGMAAREKDLELVSKAVGELFTDIASEITDINKKVQEATAQSAASHPSAPTSPLPPGDSINSIFPGEEKKVDEQKTEISEPSAPRQDTEFQKKCPMCGGRMDFYMNERMWQCFSCAFEELEEKKGDSRQKTEISEPSAQRQDTEFQKKCPLCGGRMDFYTNGRMWQCFSCAYEESQEGEVRSKSEEKSEDADTFKPMPASESIFDSATPTLSSREYREPTKEPLEGSIQGSSPSTKQPSTKKKTCPVCRKKMNWHQEEQAWLCPFCQ